MRHKEKAAQDQLVQRKKDLADELTYWEEYLINDFVCGSDFTMADVFLFTYLAQLVRGGISFDSRPNITKSYHNALLFKRHGHLILERHRPPRFMKAYKQNYGKNNICRFINLFHIFLKTYELQATVTETFPCRVFRKLLFLSITRR